MLKNTIKKLISDDEKPGRVFDYIKNVKSIEKFDAAMILMDIGDKFPNDISIKNFMIMITCVIKDVNKFYQNVYLVETSVA